MLGNTNINIDKKYYDTYKKLCKSEKGKEENKLFPTMWELFVWCAIKGFLHNQSIEVVEPYSPFRWFNIGNKHRELLLILILQNEEDFSILKDKKKIQNIAESRANGGMQILQEEMAKDNKAYTNIESLINSILERF